MGSRQSRHERAGRTQRGTAQPPAGSASFASGAVHRRAPAFVHALAACDGARFVLGSQHVPIDRVFEQPACVGAAEYLCMKYRFQLRAVGRAIECGIRQLQRVSNKYSAPTELPAAGGTFALAVTSGQSALRCEAHLFPASKNEGHWSSAHGFMEVHGRRKKLMSHSEASNVAGDFAAPRSVQSGNWMAKHPVVLKHSF